MVAFSYFYNIKINAEYNNFFFMEVNVSPNMSSFTT